MPLAPPHTAMPRPSGNHFWTCSDPLVNVEPTSTSTICWTGQVWICMTLGSWKNTLVKNIRSLCNQKKIFIIHTTRTCRRVSPKRASRLSIHQLARIGLAITPKGQFRSERFALSFGVLILFLPSFLGSFVGSSPEYLIHIMDYATAMLEKSSKICAIHIFGEAIC